MKRLVFLFVVAALLLAGFASAVPAFPAYEIDLWLSDQLVWSICYNHGFTYELAGETVTLPNIATFDVDGDIEPASVGNANWPAGEVANMRAFYRTWLVKIAKKNMAIAAHNAQRDSEVKSIAEHEAEVPLS